VLVQVHALTEDEPRCDAGYDALAAPTLVELGTRRPIFVDLFACAVHIEDDWTRDVETYAHELVHTLVRLPPTNQPNSFWEFSR
jgi:hypothetical protein